MKAGSNRAVAAWLDRQDFDALYLTTVSLAELLLGIEMMPAGKRRSALDARLGEVIATFVPARILAFDITAARLFAVLVARARAAGHVISVSDGMIAAIAAARGFTVATRDTAPFIAAAVPVINPWEQPRQGGANVQPQ
jgi:predicted nucleic acid-binding protein